MDSTLLDTDTLNEVLKQRNSLVVDKSAAYLQQHSQFAISAITRYELLRGLKEKQAAKQLASVLPLLPLPVSIPDPDLSIPLPPGETPSTSISIPQPDLVPLYDGLQDCRASAVQNDSLIKDLSDEKSRSAALLHERDAAIAVAHGGTFLPRLKRASKWFAIGVATGAAIAAVAHH